MPSSVIWITGLSAAGKTTVAKALHATLPHSILLDGDDLRWVLGLENSGFDEDSRRESALTCSRMASLLAKQGNIVIMATISLFHVVHKWNRENMPNYVEVFLDVSEEERRRRDPKGLYKAEKLGKINNMAGIQIPVQMPLQPDIHCTDNTSVELVVQAIQDAIKNFK